MARISLKISVTYERRSLTMKVNYIKIKVSDEPDEIPEEIFRLCNNINRIYGLTPILKGLITVKKEDDLRLVFCRYFGKVPNSMNSWRTEFLGIIDREKNFQPWYSVVRKELGERLPCDRPLTELIILVLALQFLLPFYDLFWDWKFHKVEESGNEAEVEVKFIRGSDDKEITVKFKSDGSAEIPPDKAGEIVEILKFLVAAAE
jgi:hypothetical protein